MCDIVIKAENLGKKYVIGHQAKHVPYLALRDVLMQNARTLWSKTKDLATGKPIIQGDTMEEVWALKDACFEISHGEALGIIGRNGAGESTLLKILSRITEPSTGRVTIKGCVASLLEVGTGFHPELTGRENIYLNGTILGMTRKEIRQKFDEIVAFAEVEKYLDTPAKRYSSGMYVRLAFAVAAHLEPEILIVDEVLAVGDAQFQRKCQGKMGEVASQGWTVLFVSHNMSAVAQLCTRGILLNYGQITCRGSIREVVDTYMRTVTEEEVIEKTFPVREGSAANITRFCLRNEQGKQARTFSNSESITFEIEYVVHRTLSNDHIYLLPERVDGLLIIKAADDDGDQALTTTRTPGRYLTKARFPGNMLNEGIYQFRVVFGKRRGVQYDELVGFTFEVEDWNDYTDSSFGKRNGVLLFPLSWCETKIESW